MAYTIEVDITGDDSSYQAMVAQAQQSTARMNAELQKSGVAAQASFRQVEQSAISGRAQLVPFLALTGQLTLLLSQQLGPAIAVAATAIDRFAAHVAVSRAEGMGLAAALSAGFAALNPYTLAVIVSAGAISYFAEKLQQAKKNTDSWQQSLSQMTFGMQSLGAMSEQEVIRIKAQQNLEQQIADIRKQQRDDGLSEEQARIQIDAARASSAVNVRQETRKLSEQQAEQLRNTQLQANLQADLNAKEKIGLALQTEIKNISERRIDKNIQAGLIRAAMTEAANRLAVLGREATDQIANSDSALGMMWAERKEDWDAYQKAGEEAIKVIVQKTFLATGDLQAADAVAAAEHYKLRVQTEDKILETMKRRFAELIAGEDMTAIGDEGQAIGKIVLDQNLKNLDVQQQTKALEVERLQALGLESQAQRLNLQLQIEAAEAQKKQIQEGLRPGTPEQIDLLTKQSEVAQLKMQSLGAVVVNVGQHVTDTFRDMWTAVINHTASAADLGKSLLGGFGRLVSDYFTQFLNKKLGFENIILTNMQGLPAQMNGALAIGAQGIGASANGGSGASGVSGSGLGGILSGFINSPLGLGIGSMATVGSLALGGVGGFGFGGLIGGNTQGSIFGMLGGLGGGLLNGTAFGAPIVGGIVNGLTSILPDTFLSSGIGSMLGGAIGSFALPVIGSILGGLIGLFFRQESPNVKVTPQVSGFSMDSFGGFNLGPIGATARATNMGSNGLADTVTQILTNTGNAFTALLNEFPRAVREGVMAAYLPETNGAASAILGVRQKFTPADMQQQLADFSGVFAPQNWYFATRGLIGTALQETFKQAGFSETLQQAVLGPFPNVGGVPATMAVLGSSADTIKNFISSLSDFTKLASQLMALKPATFLTSTEMAQLAAGLLGVLGVGNIAQFPGALQTFGQNAGPTLQWLQQAQQQATDLIGRGIQAALTAVAESQAQFNFFKALGDGTKQVIFQGISDAFIASTQFSDLLAPVQKAIRDAADQAAATGALPDLSAVRAAALPAIEQITTRAETLAPLVAQLQQFGADITKALAGLSRSGTTVNINVASLDSQTDIKALAQQIGELINGQLRT